jgi:hypothetical protein
MQQRRGTAAQWTGANPTLAAGEIGYETDTGKFKIGNGSSAWGALNYYVDANAILDGAPGVLDTLNELAAALGDDPAFITTVGTNLSNHTNATTSVHGIADTDDLATKDYVADAVSNAEVDQQTLAGTGIDWNSGTGQFDIDSTVVTLDGVQTLTNKTLSSNTVATTQLLADTSTKIATTEFVQNRVASLINNAPSALDTLNELALALANDENFAATIATDIGDLQNNVNSRLSLSGGTLEGALTLQGDPVELLHAATKNYVDNASETAATGAVGAHNLLTTNIHGIDDVGELATKSYVGDELDTHALATDVHGISDAISTHANLSLNVHGIADTSLLATTANIETHRADTTNVHGITDTADLVLTGDARLSDTRTPTDDSVSTAKIVNSAVTADKLAGDSVTTAKIEDGAVTSAKIADGTIVNADINASAAIDWTKLAVSSTSVSAHTGATTSVHGISDTSQLAYLNAANQTFTGNMEVDGNMTVDGNLTVNGTTFNASATSITIEDNMVQLAHQNAANTVDLGLVVAYNDGSAKHAGIVRDVSDSKWKLFKGVATEPSTTVAFGEGSLDDLAVAAFEATSATIGDVSNTELQYLNGVTSAIQTQLDAKAPVASPTFTGTVTVAASGVAYTDGTQTKEGVPSRTTINSISASYNLSTGGLSLRDSMVESTSATGITVTIPANSTTAYPVGTTIDFLQTAAGQITFAGAAGVTLNGTPGLKTRTQWSSASLFKRATDAWVVLGDLTA